MIAAKNDHDVGIERLCQADGQLGIQCFEGRHHGNRDHVRLSQSPFVICEALPRNITIEHFDLQRQVRDNTRQNRVDCAGRLDDLAQRVDRDRPGIDQGLRVQK